MGWAGREETMNTISLEPWVKNLTDVSVLSGMAALHQDALIWTYVMAEDNFSELVQIGRAHV